MTSPEQRRISSNEQLAHLCCSVHIKGDETEEKKQKQHLGEMVDEEAEGGDWSDQ